MPLKIQVNVTHSVVNTGKRNTLRPYLDEQTALPSRGRVAQSATTHNDRSGGCDHLPQ